MEEMNNIYEAEVNEVNELIPIELEEDEETGISTGLAMAIGGLVTAGIIIVGKKAVDGGKQLWAKHKERKAQKESESAGENAVIDAECEPVKEEVPVEA